MMDFIFSFSSQQQVQSRIEHESVICCSSSSLPPRRFSTDVNLQDTFHVIIVATIRQQSSTFFKQKKTWEKKNAFSHLSRSSRIYPISSRIKLMTNQNDFPTLLRENKEKLSFFMFIYKSLSVCCVVIDDYRSAVDRQWAQLKISGDRMNWTTYDFILFRPFEFSMSDVLFYSVLFLSLSVSLVLFLSLSSS